MVQFDMDEPVEVMVKKNNGMIQQVDIRPYSKNIEYKQVKNCIFFTLDKPQYLSVEFNGDRLNNLHLFANPVETETYKESSEGVMYFGPGTHRPGDLPNNQIRIPSNTTVYLAPGAVVEAKLLVDHAENVRIIGRGIIYKAIRGIEVTDSKNVYIDGITVVNPDHYSIFGGGSKGITVRNFKAFSCKGWSDGIDVMSCQDIANLCTANNTIAIITTGPIAKDIAVKFHLDRRKTASILDTFSCLIQGIIPYGAQMLIAAGLASISPISIIGNLYYPFTMGACALLAILFRYPKRYS
jgi:hypothetical protein